MQNICSYIYWAQLDNLTLNFTPSESDNNWCNAISDSQEYTVSYGDESLWALGAYEFG